MGVYPLYKDLPDNQAKTEEAKKEETKAVVTENSNSLPLILFLSIVSVILSLVALVLARRKK
jgi:hypothetical protein